MRVQEDVRAITPSSSARCLVGVSDAWRAQRLQGDFRLEARTQLATVLGCLCAHGEVTIGSITVVHLVLLGVVACIGVGAEECHVGSHGRLVYGGRHFILGHLLPR